MPGRLGQQPAGMPVAGPGQAAVDSGVPRGELAGHQPQVGANGAARKPVQSPISTASANAVSVETPRKHPNRRTTGVNGESAAIATNAASRCSRRAAQAATASKAAS